MHFFNDQAISIAYPTSTSVANKRPAFKQRNFRVLSVRDLVDEPLTIAEYLQRPLVRRSRYLLTVRDTAQSKWRKIYYRSALEYFRETPLRVGLFDDAGLAELTSSNWGPTVRDRLALVRFLAKFQANDLGDFRIGIFSDDLELIL